MSGCTTYGSTPSSNSPSAIVAAIAAIYTNRYNAGVTAGNNTGYNNGYNEGYLRGYNDGKAEAVPFTTWTTQTMSKNKANTVPLSTKYFFFGKATCVAGSNLYGNHYFIDFVNKNVYTTSKGLYTDTSEDLYYGNLVTETSSGYTINKLIFPAAGSASGTWVTYTKALLLS